jgi:hypothetical protein
MAKTCATEVNEGSTAWLYYTLKDQNGIAVSVSNIGTATLSLYDRDSGDVINSRSSVNVKSCYNSSGHFEFKLTPADNVIKNANVGPHEIHYAVIVTTIVQGGETDTHVETFIIKVLNQKYTS